MVLKFLSREPLRGADLESHRRHRRGDLMRASLVPRGEPLTAGMMGVPSAARVLRVTKLRRWSATLTVSPRSRASVCSLPRDCGRAVKEALCGCRACRPRRAWHPIPGATSSFVGSGSRLPVQAVLLSQTLQMQIAITDPKSRDQQWKKEAWPVIRQTLMSGGSVLGHCVAGRHRAAGGQALILSLLRPLWDVSASARSTN